MAHNFNNLKLSCDVLQPMKAPIDPHRDVAILIDITDSPEHEINLSGSDLDNIKKSEFELVDLFQNIYVTPQHIKKERDAEIDLFRTEECSSSSSIVHPYHNTIRAEDSLENEGKSERTYPHSILNDQEVKRVLKVPVVTSKCAVDCAQKKNSSTSHSLEELKYDGKKEDVMSCNIGIGNDKYLNVTNFTDRLLNKSDNIGILGNNGNLKSLNGMCTINGLYNKSILDNSKTISGDAIRLLNNKMELKTTSIDCNRKCTQIDNRNQPKIKTITLDKKTYNKQRQTKSEIEKLGYTKAPDLAEKSVILPQIMKRLDERRNSLQDFKRTEIESKPVASQCQCAKVNRSNEVNIVQDGVTQGSDSKAMSLHTTRECLSPVIALENCNRERLIAHRVHSAFQRYVLTGSYY